MEMTTLDRYVTVMAASLTGLLAGLGDGADLDDKAIKSLVSVARDIADEAIDSLDRIPPGPESDEEPEDA